MVPGSSQRGPTGSNGTLGTSSFVVTRILDAFFNLVTRRRTDVLVRTLDVASSADTLERNT